MLRVFVKILSVSIILLLAGTVLNAQVIYMRVEGLQCTSPLEEVEEFENSYNQYGLKNLYWLEGGNPHPYVIGIFYFNDETILKYDLEQILIQDPRVIEVSYSAYNHDFRQFAIQLKEQVSEVDFLDHYEQYGLKGSIPISSVFEKPLVYVNANLYVYNKRSINAGDLLDCLRMDPLVEFAYLDYVTENGVLYVKTVNLNNQEKEELFQDYNMATFSKDMIPEHVNCYYVIFDYDLFDEFFMLDLLGGDERFTFVEVYYHESVDDPTSYCACQNPGFIVSNHDHSIEPMSKIMVYPNPVREGSVTFKYNHTTEMKGQAHMNPELSIYNIKGQLIKKNYFLNGTYLWDRKDENNRVIGAGIYFMQTKIGNKTRTEKFLILK